MSAPAVAVSASGNKFAIAWKDIRSGEPNVYWAISDSPSFDEEEVVHGISAGKQDHPSLCFKNETAWVAWEDSRNGESSIWLRSSVDGDGEQMISKPEDGKTSYPSVAAGPHFVAVAYETTIRRSRMIRLCLIPATE